MRMRDIDNNAALCCSLSLSRARVELMAGNQLAPIILCVVRIASVLRATACSEIGPLHV